MGWPEFFSNTLLDSLSAADKEALRPHLKSISLAAKDVLYEAGDLVSQVYFPTGAIVSLVVRLSTGETLEAAMVGKDGVVGAAAALDGKISLSLAVVQIAGTALMCDPRALKGAALQSESLLSKIIRHEQTLFAQAQQSAACMSAHDVHSRLCRWLLRARDLAGSNTLDFTQEFLAEMLGVQRSSVTTIALTLQTAGMITYRRGKITLLDAEALYHAACECYETTNSNNAALIGPSGTK
jgi:CRP-like cAMP-binding protein